jgi:hypothetical protein
MNAWLGKSAVTDSTDAAGLEYRDPPARIVRLYVPIAAALAVALSSAVTLAAYDKPLDREALTPSVMEFIDVNSEDDAASQPRNDAPKARAMLLRYYLNGEPGAWTKLNGDAFVPYRDRVQPFLL